MARPYQTFREFYPYYLSQHTHMVCRSLHFIGSWLALAILATAIATGNAWWLAGIPLAGYGFAWAGHVFFEHNRPATFAYPVFSLVGDWVMFYQLLIGRIPFTGAVR
jgi:hypothetical protein